MCDIITLQRPLVLHLVVFSDIISDFCVAFINLAINRQGLIKQLESSFGSFFVLFLTKVATCMMVDGQNPRSESRGKWGRKPW